MKPLILFCFIQLLVFSVIGQEKRLALVIGNANYNEAKLENPINDAKLMQETFLKLGFEVVLITDIETYNEFLSIIDNYNNKRKDYSVGFIYYAGHAVQIDGVNYMLATKEKYETESNVKYKGVNISIFTDEWENPHENELNVLILDACRNNPFEKKIYGNARTIGTEGLGLAEIDGTKQPTGSIVAFSTAEGKTASDGKVGSKNSLYCQTLSTNLQLEDVSIRNIFGKVSKEIYIQTNQYPVVSDKMFDVDFYLKKSTYIDQIREIDSLIDVKAYDLARIKTTIILTKSPDNKKALLRKGRIEYITVGKKYKGSELIRASEIYPNDPDVYEFLSRYYFTIEEFDKAIENINLALRIDTTDANLYYWKSRILEKKNQFDLADFFYSKAIELDSKNSQRYYDRALFYKNQKNDYLKALNDYNEAIKLSPLNLTFLYGRALLYKNNLKKKDKANEDYLNMLKIDSANINAIYGIGLIYKEEGNFDLAIKHFSKGIDLATNNKGAAYCYGNRAEIFENQKQFNEALADYNKAIELDSKNSQRYYDRALFYKNQKNDYLKALNDYNEAIKLSPLNLTFLYGRALLYKNNLKKKDKANEDYLNMLKIDSTNINAINGIGLIYKEEGNFDLAIKQFSKGIELATNNKAAAYCYGNRADIYEIQKQFNEALEDYNKAVELDSENSHRYYDRALFNQNNKKDYPNALIDFNLSLKMEPSNLSYLIARAEFYKEYLSDNIKAIEDYQKIIKLDSSNIEAINSIGLIYVDQGKFELAINEFSKGIELESYYYPKWDKNSKTKLDNISDCYMNRADVYSKLDKIEEALRDYEKSIDLAIFEGEKYFERGKLYLNKLNRPFDALVDYSIAISEEPWNITFLWNRGKLYSEKLDNQELAIQDFEQILKIRPNDVNALNWKTIFYHRNNEISRAIEGYKSIINLGDSIKKLEAKIGDFGWANINLAEIYQCEDNIEEALNLYNEGVTYISEDPKSYYYRAWFLALYMSKYDEAIFDLSTSIKLEPKNPHWLLNRSKIFQMKGDLKSAKNDISEAVKISKESAIYIAERGNFYSITGEYDKATKDFKESLKLDSANRRTYHFITEDLIRQGKIDDAIKNATAICKLFKNDTVSFEQLGRIYFAKNDVHKSLSTYAQAASIMEFNEGDRTIYPHDIQVFLSDIHLKIAEIYKKLNQSDLEYEALSKAKEIVIFETRPDRQKMIIEIQEKLKNCQN